MKLVKEYVSLEDTLLHLKRQVVDSLPYATEFIPETDSPEELYYWMRERFKFKNDPADRELLQTLPTLVSGERTGIPWAGDCDCATIASLAALLSNNLSPAYVILVGRRKDVPVHIYAGIEEDGEVVPFDLTNDEYGFERDEYSYKQVLPFRI